MEGKWELTVILRNRHDGFQESFCLSCENSFHNMLVKLYIKSVYDKIINKILKMLDENWHELQQ